MFKRVLQLSILIALITSCKKEVALDYATVSGKITNHLGKDGSIKGRSYSKEIKIAKDGTFSDTLHLSEKGTRLSFSDGNEVTSMFLKNGDNITLNLDTKMFDETLVYTGKGSETNNYLAKKALLKETAFSNNIYEMDKPSFEKELVKVEGKFSNLIDSFKGLDTGLAASEKKSLTGMSKFMLSNYDAKAKVAKLKGNPSPQFNYENYKGGKTSLKSLKGKYVYVDVWATWCGPCKAEIPHLQKLEKEFHNKNIEFVSISVDKKDKHDAWRQMIKDKEMSGIQLFADNDWKSDFVKAYGINGIPRFILIDPKGNVVNSDASRPSEPSTKALFDKILK
ncbi:MAG: TlpA disulfide reductase family protein [Flavobacteriaceae bacterium]